MTGHGHISAVATRELSRPGLIQFANKSVFIRAGLVAILLGTLLTAVNQPASVSGDRPFDTLPLVLGYLTPFVVVVISQLLGMRQARIETNANGRPGSSGLLVTACKHGIPGRAVAVGLVVGFSNTVLIAAATFAATNDLSSLPAALIAQTFILPIVFGLLSQAIAYRRALSTLR